MSDFVPRDMLPDLWEEILKRHWSFLETEESIQKLEERKKLEGCLKEFLCIVPHDRKFFLPETAHVLRKSIREMDDFTAYKAIIGLESISQYANNLFTKPWRKEFRVLKMYSGFFQHEVKSNLLDSEKLFEAMGYRRLTDEVLILDGPICPDQVTNVSRDAMAAYMECQIMKHIYTGLVAQGLTCSWQDVYHYREKYVGGTSQAIKGLAYAIQERRLRKEKLANAENCYATIQHSPQPPTIMPACQSCASYNMTQPNYATAHTQLPSGHCPLHHSAGNNNCGKLLASYPAPANYQQLPYAGATMSHSRSLEHYNEPPALHLPHRHSFDQQQQGCMAAGARYCQQPSHAQHVYESPYDCLDGVSMGSSASYAAVAGAGGGSNLNAAYAHPYNVSGNRYPLPYNISNQLNSHYATPTVTCNGIKGDAAYPELDNDSYATSTKLPHACSYHTQPRFSSSAAAAATNAKELHNLRQQRSFPPAADHLIDFDDRAPLTAHDFHAHLHAAGSLDHAHDRMYDHRTMATHPGMHATYAQPQDLLYQQAAAAAPASASSSAPLPSSSDDMVYSNHMYARPLPRGSRARVSLGPSTNATDKYLKNAKLELADNVLDNNHKILPPTKELRGALNGSGSRRKLAVQQTTSSNERDTSDLSYESTTDDFVNVAHSERPAVHTYAQRSPTQASKNQDGFGSFGSWDYVFQNLDRTGYNKDLGERGDLLVQSLDLDSLHLANGAVNGTEKRRATNAETTKASRLPNTPQQTAEKTKVADVRNSKIIVKQEKSILKPQTVNPSSSGTTSRKTKSALKSSTAATTTTFSDNNNGNGNVLGTSTSTGAELRRSTRKMTDTPTAIAKRQSSGTSRTTNNSSSKHAPAVSTQVIVSSPNEWSCRFCTFLNPDTKRICEMCCRSKDFNLEAAAVSNTPTCV